MSIFKLKTKDQRQRRIHKDLDIIIKKIQRDLQLEENFNNGKKARTASYLDASLEFARRLKNAR